MKSITAYLIFGLIPNLFAQSGSPVVSNVVFYEREDRSFIVDIYYDVSDSNNVTLTVAMQASSDAGQTWDFPADSIYGDVGEGVAAGAGKHIVWNFGAEHPQFYSDKIQIKIIADNTFNCGKIITYAGKIYNTVLIGTQCWLEENLDVGTILISNNGSENQTDNGVIEKYCYDNDISSCNHYGGLYQWNEAMAYDTTEGARGICPNSWHIPTKSELQALSDAVNGSSNALKAIGQGEGSGAGTNTSGFSALLAGYRLLFDGAFYSLSYETNFWSSSEGGSGGSANSIYLDYDSDNIFTLGYNGKYASFSVRCLKD